MSKPSAEVKLLQTEFNLDRLSDDQKKDVALVTFGTAAASLLLISLLFFAAKVR